MNKETVIYKNVNNCSIKADLYLTKEKNSPVIMLIHGGALIWGSRESIIPEQIELYNKAGFTVISVDYRLAPETKLEWIIEDIYDAIKWIKNDIDTKYNINTEQLAVVGSSAGGYLGLMSGTFNVKPKVIVSFYGYGDITGDWYGKPSDFYRQRPLVLKKEAYSCLGEEVISEGSRDRFKFYLYCRQNGLWTYEVSRYDMITDLEKLKMYCPYYIIKNDYPPTLFLHGDMDTDVPYEQSVIMARKLQNNGVPNKLITLRGKGHVFDRDMEDKQVMEAYHEVISFLKEYIK